MQVTIFDTGIATSNLGDEIIMDSCKKHLSFLLDESFVLRVGTHVRNFSNSTYLHNRAKVKAINNSDFKFILGTNLLSNDLYRTRRQWNVDLFSVKLYINSIMYGVGLTSYNLKKPSFYTRFLYNKLLRKDIVHSVRDDKSKSFLEQFGVKVLNTGCPTLWDLNEKHCLEIPIAKSKKAIISLSGYKSQQDTAKDRKMLDIVFKNYAECYFWNQTTDDLSYLHSLRPLCDVKVINSLSRFKTLCQEGDVDYIGTRLHGGIFALQNKVRSIIVAIDGRARGFKESNNIVTLERSEIESLDDIINSKFSTEIVLRRNDIETFLEQFR